MPLLSNRVMARVNLHFAVQTFSQQLGGVFVFVFLLKAGTPAPLVLLTLAGMNVGRLAFRPAVLVVGRRIGLRRNVMLGSLLEAAVFPLLPLVHGPGPLLLAYIVLASIGSVFYWTSYHAYFAALGDAENRGGQVGAREAMAAALGVIAPGLGGWALSTAGPQALFWAAGVVQAAAVLPLLGAPDVAVETDGPRGFRAGGVGTALFFTDGWIAACSFTLWQVALFVTLGETFAGYGGAMALAALVGGLGSLALGRLIDLGHARRTTILVYILVAGMVTLKWASFGHAWLAVAANAVAGVTQSLQTAALMACVYNLAKRSPCPLRFHMATEGGWDSGSALGCAVAAAMIWAGASIGAPILLALIGVAACAALLIRTYGEAPAFRAAS